MFQRDDLFRNGVALLAFVMAFYALVARERKTPYMVHSVYTISFLVLGALFLSLASNIFEPAAISPGTAVSSVWSRRLRFCAASLLGLGLVHILYRIWREQNR